MRKDKEKAFELRRSGLSYKQIRTQLGIPLTTLSDWFRTYSWSIEIKHKLASEASLANPKKIELMAKATRVKWEKIHKEWQEEAKIEFKKLKNNPLFVAGLMLYWGEGDKILQNCSVRFTNSDPSMIRLFYIFLKDVLKTPEENITASLLLYPDLIDKIQVNFWSKAAGIPIYQFRKSIFIQGRHPTRRLSYGVCNVRVGSRKLKEKIMIWIDLTRTHLESITRLV